MAGSQTFRTPLSTPRKTTIETLTDMGSSVVKNTVNGIGDISTNMFDQLMGFGTYRNEQGVGQEKNPHHSEKKPAKHKEKKTIWTFQQEQEQRTIRELVDQIRQQVKLLDKEDKAFMREVKDIEKLTIDEMPEGSIGIYHVRFLELVVSLLRQIRLKVQESRTWLHAYATKKAKRGAAYSARKNKMGSQYAMSEELKITRNAVQ